MSFSVERILCDLTMEQAISFGMDIEGLNRDQIQLRMAALVETSKKDREHVALVERELKTKSYECEQLERKVTKLKSQLVEMENRQPEPIPPPNQDICIPSNVVKKKVVATQPILKAPIPKLPTAPSKFSAGVKKSFQISDGLGGTKRSYPF